MFTALIAALVFAPTPPAVTSPEPVEASAGPHPNGLSLGLGLMPLFSADSAAPSLLVPLSLEGSLLATASLDVFVSVPLALARVPVGAPTASGEGWVVVTGGQVGLRKLLGAGRLRPFLGGQLTGLYVLRPTTAGLDLGDNVLAGPGAIAGLQLDVAESLTLRLQGTFDWFITLDGPQRLSASATFAVATRF